MRVSPSAGVVKGRDLREWVRSKAFRYLSLNSRRKVSKASMVSWMMMLVPQMTRTMPLGSALGSEVGMAWAERVGSWFPAEEEGGARPAGSEEGGRESSGPPPPPRRAPAAEGRSLLGRAT